MDKTALRILKELGQSHEVSLLEAIRLGKTKGGDHVGQYPLVLLLEDGYLGMTLSHYPPEGADQMAQKSRDRVWSFILGLAGGVIGGIALAWLKQTLKM